MMTQREAEELAMATVAIYLDECGCTTNEERANVLMKLCSVTGVAMASVAGPADAAERLRGTALFIEIKSQLCSPQGVN